MFLQKKPTGVGGLTKVRSNRRYLCKLLVWANVIVLLYFNYIILDQNQVIVGTNNEEEK